MPENPTEGSPWPEGERYEETTGEELFDEEELDPEEAERRITQFVTSAEELPGPPVAELAEQVVRSCEQHRASSKRSWMGSPTTRYWPRNSCLASELA